MNQVSSLGKYPIFGGLRVGKRQTVSRRWLLEGLRGFLRETLVALPGRPLFFLFLGLFPPKGVLRFGGFPIGFFGCPIFFPRVGEKASLNLLFWGLAPGHFGCACRLASALFSRFLGAPTSGR